MHLLAVCKATADIRDSKLPGLYNIIAQYFEQHRLLTMPSHSLLTQFIIDCTSLNLPADARVPPDHPGQPAITKQCSVVISAILKERTKQLKNMGAIR